MIIDSTVIPDQEIRFGPILAVIITTALFIGLALEIGTSAVLMALAAAPFFALLLNYRVAFLLLVVLIPNLGEIETDRYAPLFWMVGFFPFLCAWVFTLILRPRDIELPLFPAFLFGLMFLSAAVSHFIGYDLGPLASIWQGRDWPLWPTVDFFTSLAIGFMAMTVFRNETDLRRIYIAFIASGVPYAITIFFFGHEVDPLTGLVESRTQGFYGHPHMASTHMVVCAILAANFARYASGAARWLSIACSTLFLTTLGFASSKTTVAAIPVVIFVWVAMELDLKRAFLGVVGVIAVVILIVPVLPESVKRDLGTIAVAVIGSTDPHAKTLPGEGKLNTFKERFIQIDEGLELIKAEPWIGYGPGRITHVSKIPSRFAGPQIHNYYVQNYFEFGVFGGTIFLTLVLSVLTLGFFNALRLRGDPTWHLVRGLLLSALMVALIITLNSGSVGARIIWCSLGLLAGSGCLLRRSVSDSGP